jgi:Heavy metal binding domain
MNFIERHINAIGILLLMTFAVAAAGLYWNVPERIQRTPQADAAKANYTCPMHPSVTSDKPGNCPICGMKLVAAVSALPTEAGCCGASIAPDAHAGCSHEKQTNSSCGVANLTP